MRRSAPFADSPRIPKVVRVLVVLVVLVGCLATIRAEEIGGRGDPPDPDENNARDDAINEEFSRPENFPSELKITSIEDMPYSGLLEENGTYVGTGYAFYLLNLVRDKLNFTYTIVPPKTNSLGNYDAGILSQLYKKEVDMVVAFIPVFPEMLRYGSFSVTLDETAMTVLMKRPPESATGSGLLAPFDTTVWYLVLTSVVVVGPVIYIFVLLRSKLWKGVEVESYSLLTCVWFVYGALLKQGSNVVATSDSTRLLFATWWIFIMILTSFYTANLTAFLTRPQFTLPIKSLEDIVKQGYKWASFGGRSVDFLLSQKGRTEVSLLKRIIYKGEYVWDYKHPENEILSIVNHGSVFLAESHFLRSLLLRDYLNKTAREVDHASRCTYVIMPGNIFVQGHAFGFPFNSTIKKFINEELMSIVRSGLIKHLKNVDVPIAETCPVDLRSTERQLRNSDLYLTYMVIAFGFSVATLAFVYELATKYLRERRGSSLARRIPCLAVEMCREKSSSTASKTPQDSSRRSPQEAMKLSPQRCVQSIGSNAVLVGRRHFINGRDYYVVVERNGERRLIPVRTPSAVLFQYAA